MLVATVRLSHFCCCSTYCFTAWCGFCERKSYFVFFFLLLRFFFLFSFLSLKLGLETAFIVVCRRCLCCCYCCLFQSKKKNEFVRGNETLKMNDFSLLFFFSTRHRQFKEYGNSEFEIWVVLVTRRRRRRHFIFQRYRRHNQTLGGEIRDIYCGLNTFARFKSFFFSSIESKYFLVIRKSHSLAGLTLYVRRSIRLYM